MTPANEWLSIFSTMYGATPIALMRVLNVRRRSWALQPSELWVGQGYSRQPHAVLSLVFRGARRNHPILALPVSVVGFAKPQACRQQEAHDGPVPDLGRHDEMEFMIGQDTVAGCRRRPDDRRGYLRCRGLPDPTIRHRIAEQSLENVQEPPGC